MKRYYKIGEISKIYGIGKDSLIYYEELGIIKPVRDTNGYRLYDVKDAWELNLIKELREFDIPMKRIKKYLQNRSLASTKRILKEEISIMDNEIEILTKNKKNLKERLSIIENTDNNLELDKIGITYDTETIIKDNKNSYKNAFYIIESTSSYDGKLSESQYVTYSYKGSYKNDITYINNMLKFIKENKYKITGDIIKICKINIHETEKENEFISEIQIPVSTY